MSNHDLPKETEARFLVSRLPPSLLDFPHSSIKQGYAIATPQESLRLRQKDERYLLTVKRGQGLSRTEVEISLSAPQFQALWPLTKTHRLTKTRYCVPLAGSLTAELDHFHGELEGLVTVEVEFTHEEAYREFLKAGPPPWFGEEVTEDSRYLNQSLALFGIPT